MEMYNLFLFLFLKHEGPLTTTFKHNTFKLEKKT